MFGLHIEMSGGFDLDKIEVEADCPRCGFSNPIWIRQARLRDVIICRGCKANIHLDDQMNSVRKSVANIRRHMRRLRETIERINRR